MKFLRPSNAFGWIANAGAAVLVAVCLLSSGCSSEPPSNGSRNAEPPADSPAAPPATKPPVADVNDAKFHAAITAAAEQYLTFAMVNTSDLETPLAKLAPVDCAPPVSVIILEEPAARMSQAETGSDAGHAQKLYFLFAKEISHYTNPNGSASPVGQTLVKESWTAVPGNPEARNLRNHVSGNQVNPRVKVGDKTLKLGKRKHLFVMLKQDPKTEGTDDGWVYGVIDPKSHEIKSAGAVASCIACHENENDRLFRDGIIDWEAQAKSQSSTTSSDANE